MTHKIPVWLSMFVYILISCNTQAQYICPPCESTCDSLVFNQAGDCPQCHMKLVLKSELKKDKVSKKTIAFYLQDGTEVLDFAGPMEVFSYAGYKVFTVSKTMQPIRSQGILRILPDYSIHNAPKADIIALFGGNASAAAKDKSVVDWIKSQEKIEYYFTVCTGAFILAETGILNGKSATTFHKSLNHFESRYPQIKVHKAVRFVDNGNIITTAGISAGIDGALHLVARLEGLDRAKWIASHMEYDKWVPGEGLILIENNPYISEITPSKH